MPPKAYATAIARAYVQGGPPPHERVFTIGADQPARANAIEVYLGAPAQMNAKGRGMLDQYLMERGAPDAAGAAYGKLRRDRRTSIEEANTPKRERIGSGNRNADLREGGPRVRHQAFSAGFVSRWNYGIRHRDMQALLPDRDRGG